MMKLATAKKIMDKVETGSYKKGQVNEKILFSDPNDLLNETQDLKFNQNNNTNYNNQGNELNIEKIKNSKLPDSIKRAMIENPIQQISLTETIDKKVIDGAKRLMVEDKKRDGVGNENKSKNLKQDNISLNQLIPLMEKIVKKTVSEILDQKLNEILIAQKSTPINENLVLKVGDSIFKGKITGVSRTNPT